MENGSCEMCGKEGILLQATVEKSIMSLCAKCASYGRILDNNHPKQKFQSRPTKEFITSFIPDFHRQIQKMRERKGLTQADLARALAEKESVIHKIEAGHYTPEIKLAKKLEQYLGIKITEQLEPVKETSKIDFKNEQITIGDLLKKK